jgi:Carboxypeptidase regulatory-like domain/TonB-dependent Receptor Plug Domain/TonB dependent receptor
MLLRPRSRHSTAGPVARAAAAVLLAFAGIAGPVSAQVAQQPATIAGHVNGSSSAGVGGAAVTLDGPARASATTDGSGNFSFSVPPGDYTITVNKGGYQTGSTQVLAAPGATANVAVTLTESSLSNLQVIGRTSTTVGGAKFNISSSPSVTLSQQLIQDRNVPDLPKLVSSLPGIVASTNSATNNSFFRIHGLGQETMVTIDGHPISSGVSGTYLGQFTDTGLLGGIDVLKGAGLNGPTAGESAVGTLNIRTPDFSAKNTGFFEAGVDNFGGTLYTGLVNFNVDKFSFVLGKSFSGYRGPAYGQSVYGITGTRPNADFTYTTPYLTSNVVGYSQDFSSPQEMNAELAKVRYRFSDATSLAFEFFGNQSTLDPEGASFGQFVGYATIPQCVAGGKAASGAGCGFNASYNSPFLPGLAGQTNVPLYTFFPGTSISNNNPNFNLDFKTTIGNDTLLLRPYAASITRLSDGLAATSIYGNGATAQASFQVINNANCQVQFVAPTAAGGAKGPCYQQGAAAGTPGFVNSLGGASTMFPVTTNANGLTCTAATPCYTTSTAQNNAGVWGYGTPSYTLEYDKLAGYTFSYIHPVANNIYNLSIDHYYNDTVSYSGDLTPLAAGCAFTQAGGAAPASTADPGFQPSCPLAGGYKATPLAIPDTFSSVTSFSLTAQFQLSPKLEFDFGNYLTIYHILGQQEDPGFLNTFGAAQVAAGDKVNLALAPIVLSGFVNSASHYDPHFGFVWRPTRDLAIRATAGSSIEVPYASLVSGLTSQTTATNGFAFTVPNPNLLPEVVVAEDLGGDYRFKNGTVLSVDVFNDFVHNTWLQTQLAIPPPPGYATNVSYFQEVNLNGSGRQSRGVEFTLANMPQLGFGYSLSGTVNRLNYVNLPTSFEMLGTYTPDGAQDYGYPYTKGYLNMQYALKHDSLVRLGVDYEGYNNSYNAPAYTQLDAGVRLGLTHGWALQAAVENLNNVNFGALYAHAVYNQGNVPVMQTLNTNGTFSYSNGPGRGLSAPYARTVRISAIKRL